MKLRSVLRNSASLAALAMFFVLASPFVAAQSADSKPDSKEISNLLLEAKSHAVLVADDAAILESYTRTRSGVSWQAHSAKLAAMADHVNALGAVNKQLRDLNSEGSPWQKAAIGRIDPLLRDMAAQLTLTIKHLNAHQSKVHLQPYRDYVQASYERASRTAQMISDFVEYDRATSKADALEQKLELSEAEKGV
jgi:hypothetical protein